MKTTLEDVVKFCNAGWGDAFNITFQCMKAQGLYYSPWIAGFFGVLLLATAGPYGGYHGAGGAGSHYARRRFRPRTKKRLAVLIIVSVVVGVGAFLYANYEITIGDQKVDDVIPQESIKKTIEEFSKNFPVKLEERPK